jgi:hypothetical protein
LLRISSAAFLPQVRHTLHQNGHYLVYFSFLTQMKRRAFTQDTRRYFPVANSRIPAADCLE